MTEIKLGTKTHPTDIELSDLLGHSLAQDERERLERHIAGCEDCLKKVISGYEAVEAAGFKKSGKREVNFMKKISPYLILSIVTFLLSFTMPRYFLQFLAATLLFGIKWIVDSKSTKMLVMIYEAWKSGGEKEAGRIIKTLYNRLK